MTSNDDDDDHHLFVKQRVTHRYLLNVDLTSSFSFFSLLNSVGSVDSVGSVSSVSSVDCSKENRKDFLFSSQVLQQANFLGQKLYTSCLFHSLMILLGSSPFWDKRLSYSFSPSSTTCLFDLLGSLQTTKTLCYLPYFWRIVWILDPLSQRNRKMTQEITIKIKCQMASFPLLLCHCTLYAKSTSHFRFNVAPRKTVYIFSHAFRLHSVPLSDRQNMTEEMTFKERERNTLHDTFPTDWRS